MRYSGILNNIYIYFMLYYAAGDNTTISRVILLAHYVKMIIKRG